MNPMLDWIAKYQFWRAKRITIDKHYTFFVNLSEPESVAIKILKKYPGVIIEFNNIVVGEEGMMHYDLNIIANPNLCNVESKKFKNFTTDIFRSIIINSIKNAEEMNENGKSDPVESSEERELHEESTTVSEERVSERKPRKKAVRRNKAIHSKV